jgi:hypothetical protein
MYKVFFLSMFRGLEVKNSRILEVKNSSYHGNKLTSGCQRDTTSFGFQTGGIVTTPYGIMPVPGVIFRLKEVAL